MKAIALDLDGTLLTSKKTITKETIEVIESLYKDGVEILIVTGRPVITARKAVEALSNRIKLSLVCYNGAVIFDTEKEKIVEEKLLPSSQLKKVINFCREKKQNLNIFRNDIWHVESLDSFETKYYQKHSGMEPALLDFNILAEENITKTIMVGEHNHLREMKKGLEEILQDEAYVVFSQERYLEVLNKDVNKGKILKRILREKGIDIKDCIAFGDSPNDIEMLKVVGTGVAMGNALEEVKEVADYIADTNDNDGIVKFLKELEEGKIK